MTAFDTDKPHRLWRPGSWRLPAMRRQRKEPAPPVLAPYFGYKTTPLQRALRRLLAPFLAVFCLFYGLAFGFYGPFIPGPFATAPAVLALLVVWALPEMKTAPTRPMVVLFFAELCILCLWPNYLAVALPGLPWITPYRIFALILAVYFLVSISVNSAFRKDLLGVIQAVPVIWRFILAFAAIQFMTVIVSPHAVGSLEKAINYQFNWTLIFFVSCFVFMKPGRPTIWAAIFCISLAIVAPLIFLEVRNGQVIWADHIPSFLKVNDPSVARALVGGGRGGQYRAQGTFSTSLGLGEYTALLMPFILYFLVGPFKPYVRAAAGAAIPVIFWCVIQSDSRIGFIGCLISLLTFSFAFAFFQWRIRKEALLPTAVIFGYPVMAGAVVLSTFFVGRIRNHVWGGGQYNDSNTARQQMFADGIPMIFKRPWGHGAGTGAEVLGHTNPGGDLSIDTYYIQMGLEYGVLGFIIYFAIWGIAIYMSARDIAKYPRGEKEHALLIPIAVSLFNFFLIKSSFSQDDNHPLVYMMLGMAVALIWRRKQAEAKTPAPVAAPVLARSRPRLVTRSSGGGLQPGE